MKKTLISICFLFASILVIAQESSAPAPKELGGVVVSHSKVAGLKRLPTNAAILMVIENTSVIIRCSNDFGLGTYQLQDLPSGISSNGTIDTSLDNMVEIPFCVSDSSVLDFYIEFEDGSWCHLTWNCNE